jgi:Ca2+-binding RTX toxin-like protein
VSSVNGVYNGYPSPLTIQSEGTTPPPSPSSNDEVAVVQNQSPETPVAEGEIPDPGASASGGSLDREIEQLSELYRLLEQLAYLAERGDKAAQNYFERAAAEIAALEKNISQKYGMSPEEIQEFLQDPGNPDFDGDGLTNAYEQEIGTNPFSEDTDRDGLSDFAEVKYKGKFEEGVDRRLNPLNADNDGDGIVDGRQIPEFIKKAGTDDEGGIEGSEGTGGDSSQVFWPATPSDAFLIDTASGDPVSSSPWTTINVQGEATISLDGNDLLIKDSQGTVRIKDYLGPDGKPQKVVELKGETSQIKTYNLNPDVLKPTTDSNGVATGGLKIAGAPDLTSVVDPFNGAVPYTVVDGEIRYDAASLSGTFAIPEWVDGKEVKQVSITREGNDVVVELKDKTGAVLKRFRLTNGYEAVRRFDITFQGGNNGILVDAPDMKIELHLGSGNDMAKVGGGSIVTGGRGNDTLVHESNGGGNLGVNFHGDEGDDTLVGSDFKDSLSGDDGMDLIYGGRGADTLLGGSDSDVLITHEAEGGSLVDGGAGIDTTNALGSGVKGIEVGPSQGTATEDHLEELLNDPSLSEERKKALEEALDLADKDQTEAANAVRDTILNYLMNKLAQTESEYTGSGSAGPWSDLPPPDEEEDI